MNSADDGEHVAAAVQSVTYGAIAPLPIGAAGTLGPAVFRPGTPLRLNDGLITPVAAADPLGGLEQKLLSLCDPWSRNAASFVRSYFSLIVATCEAHKDVIEERLARFGGLYGYRDMLYSAWLPLPRAHLSFGSVPPIAADFLFWSGVGFLAVDVAAERRRVGAQNEAVRRIAVCGALLANPSDRTWTSEFPPELLRFWDVSTLPAGPGGPQAHRFRIRDH